MTPAQTFCPLPIAEVIAWDSERGVFVIPDGSPAPVEHRFADSRHWYVRCLPIAVLILLAGMGWAMVFALVWALDEHPLELSIIAVLVAFVAMLMMGAVR